MHSDKQVSNKYQRYRERLKARGMRQIQLWVPDVNRPGFRQELARQLRRIEESPDDAETLTCIEQTADWSE
ncbi:MAG: antitoxin MazE family protein [Gammaproteobacteria bacterium]|nr:antitoxin MazE family protein [Gammaproteobacteria bacterium]